MSAPSNRLVQKLAFQHKPGEIGPSLKKLSKAEARAKYERYLKNHPTGNVAYFDAWEQLSKAEQRKWRDPLYRQDAHDVAKEVDRT